MPGDRRKDLELALRENRGRRLIADWSARLSGACGHEISASSFLSIEKTEELKVAFFTKLRDGTEALKVNWIKQEQTELLTHLLDVSVAVGALQVVLLSSVDRFIGGVYLPANCVLRNVMATWKVVEEDLSMATEDLQHGFCLEENFYTPAGHYVAEGIYDISAWGAFARARKESATH